VAGDKAPDPKPKGATPQPKADPARPPRTPPRMQEFLKTETDTIKPGRGNDL
jgi:hypothetical protein